MSRLYRICIEVIGTPVSTDDLLRNLNDNPSIKSIMRPLKADETWRDAIYKQQIRFEESE